MTQYLGKEGQVSDRALAASPLLSTGRWDVSGSEQGLRNLVPGFKSCFTTSLHDLGPRTFYAIISYY